jgi:hypothetical protein
MATPIKTLVIDNFKGNSTVNIYGDLNSGLVSNIIAAGYDPLSKPGLLTWSDAPVQIDAAGSVLTDLILAGKPRVESGVTYVYCIGHTGRVYKIQVNDPTSYNPDYDNPVLLTTITSGSPTFTRGGFIDFYGSTERIYIGHDKGVTRINFDGTNETAVTGTWTQNVPRPFRQFLGNLYVGNGSNIAEISSAAIVTTSTKLSPSFPVNSQVRDLDVTPDGNYLQAVVTDLALADITATTPDTSIVGPSNSYTFIWNGTDTGYTSTTFYPSTVLSAATMFGNKQYVFGYDFLGGAVYEPVEKIITSIPGSEYSESPFPNAVQSISNVVTWFTPWPFDGFLTGVYVMYGTIADHDMDLGYWTPLALFATAPETDILHIPCQIPISNFTVGSSFSGYANDIIGTPKIYYSTVEVSSAPTTKYRFYKWNPIVTGLNDAGVGINSLYQTQCQPFSKKIQVGEIRVYGWPWISGNSFQVDLVGPDNNVIPGTTVVFTAGTNLQIGSDYAWFTPKMSPRTAIAVRITNLGAINHVISKIELDIYNAGK